MAPAALGSAVAVLLFELLLRANGEPLFQRDSVHAGLVVLTMPVWSLLLGREFGIELTPHRVVVHGSHRRAVDWHTIQDVRIEEGPSPCTSSTGSERCCGHPTRGSTTTSPRSSR
ncbi:hypothetical protein [Kitasatospora paranensis]|uniref:hypothetical protein n=1 Tax=Kitasatospora paranensis TaxID=258053 RepID=UPI0031EF571A